MTTEHLQKFYLMISRTRRHETRRLSAFSLISIPNGEVGSRQGFTIEHLRIPSQLGRLDVERHSDGNIWKVETSNVRSFTVQSKPFECLGRFEIDGHVMDLSTGDVDARTLAECVLFVLSDEGIWRVQPSGDSGNYSRRRSQLGGPDALLRSKNTTKVQYHNPAHLKTALNIAQNLYQYFRADVEISATTPKGGTRAGNRVRIVASGEDNLSDQRDVSIHIGEREVKIVVADGASRCYRVRPGMGLYRLSATGDDQVEMILWGSDEVGLQRVARLLPTTTGVGQPDWVLIGPKAAWQGPGGVLAMGFLDADWKVTSAASFLS